MKPSNPMQQLQQWKDNRNANLHSANTNQSKIGSVKNTQVNAHSEAKSKYQGKLYANPLAFKCSQLTRQFKLILDSNRKCLEVYPDDFHHKIKFRDELTDLVVRLKTGGKLFNEMVKAQGAKLSSNKQETIRNFNQANDYLIHKFGEVIKQIEQLQVENIEKQKLIVSEGK